MVDMEQLRKDAFGNCAKCISLRVVVLAIEKYDGNRI